MKLYTAEQIRQALATAHGSYKSESELDELLTKLDTELSKATTQPYFTRQQIDTAISTAFDKADEQGNLDELVSYIDAELDALAKGRSRARTAHRATTKARGIYRRLSR